MSKVFVATIDTYYAVVAVAETYGMAEFLAGEKAFEFLTRNGDSPFWSKEKNTIQDVIEYFSVTVTEVEVGSATFEGNLGPA